MDSTAFFSHEVEGLDGSKRLRFSHSFIKRDGLSPVGVFTEDHITIASEGWLDDTGALDETTFRHYGI